ncbi:hypothetical protein INQ51_12875 [Maribellus sp. CM-23]|uniref:hypothetical protein n=1 Tax=Maribellus sp. CM-23 TaxID=2781026 RepID=UPI001F2BD858|nr:hypothetical protein [Maribellus sp. CM-23]MCE4565204.1 hypothetical protein [Maribellus sp. CM-23]
MKRSLLIFALFALVISCKSIYYSDLSPKGQVSNKLPALQPQYNTYNLENIYSRGSTVSSTSGAYNSYYIEKTDKTLNSGYSTTTSTSYADERIQDVITIFEKDVIENITNNIGQKKGYARFNIRTGESYSKFKTGNFLIGWCFLFTPYLFGMNASKGITTLEVEVELCDLSGNTVGRYNAFSHVEKTVALWRGYNKTNAVRMSNIECVTNCLNQIKEKIDNDSRRLRTLLN